MNMERNLLKNLVENTYIKWLERYSQLADKDGDLADVTKEAYEDAKKIRSVCKERGRF